MENSSMNTVLPKTTTVVITPEALLEHWQGHRRLTKRMLEIFPENEFYTFSIGGMRTYAQLTMEMTDLALPGIKGIATGDWSGYGDSGDNTHSTAPKTKKEVLEKWDFITDQINAYWPQIAPERYQEVEKAFGQFEAPIYGTLLYLIDNEIHHRAQGYVYLRALGTEPPAFWDRS
ncbi:damage-inducible protein DinB [Dyadobacter flavalbus]|uniref:Damage-inducible protein DinB n=2 Tax=Dyadobacter flavalbus TaxID=2579942 RepID=A0A5M8QWY3_9BACT|nr:damage-inducible protein DinB [Dyadobacter flavalbus]